ncbi:unnamed protein product [Somion occarium]|uniref:F-box domain-containing protein n=1 Tax=Somion occarium TaxID=3059160 RepID=A0ABP1CQS2_9APHY
MPPSNLPSLFNEMAANRDGEEGKAPPKCLPPQKEKLGHLRVFPDEIISLILKSIETKEDIARFSLANIYVFYIGYEVLQRRYMAERPSWAGGRLICVGDYARIEDLPPGVFTKEEVEDMKQYQDNLLDPAESIGSLHHYLPATYPFRRRVELGFDYGTIHRLMMEIRKSERTSSEYRSRIYNALSELGSPRLLYKSEHPWILCNLSKMQFIRFAAVSELHGYKPEDPLQFIHPGFSVGTLLVSRICWSWDSSTSLCYKGAIHHGVWAGNRFEVTTMDRLRPTEGGKEWKDVTDEVVDEAIGIWKEHFGKKWRKYL